MQFSAAFVFAIALSCFGKVEVLGCAALHASCSVPLAAVPFVSLELSQVPTLKKFKGREKCEAFLLAFAFAIGSRVGRAEFRGEAAIHPEPGARAIPPE